MPPASSMVHFDALASSPTHANLSPQKLKATPSLTEKQRDALIEDLKLELQTRIRKLRAHHELASKALRTKIEMRINRVPKRFWNKTLREIQDELRLGKPPATVKSGHLSRVHKASAPVKSALKKSPVKLPLARVPAKPITSVPSYSPIRQTQKKPLGTLSPAKSLYPTITEAPFMRSPKATSRELAKETPSDTTAFSTGTRSRAGTRTVKTVGTGLISSTQTKPIRVIKKSASNSSISSTTTKSKASARTTTSASTTGTGRRVGRPPKAKPVATGDSSTNDTSETASTAVRRPVTRNLRSRG